MNDEEWWNRSIAANGGCPPDPLSRAAQEGKYDYGLRQRQQHELRTIEEANRQKTQDALTAFTRAAESCKQSYSNDPSASYGWGKRRFGVRLVVVLFGICAALAAISRLSQPRLPPAPPAPAGNPYQVGSRGHMIYEYEKQLRQELKKARAKRNQKKQPIGKPPAVRPLKQELRHPTTQ